MSVRTAILRVSSVLALAVSAPAGAARHAPSNESAT
jgi:hypothetical protein